MKKLFYRNIQVREMRSDHFNKMYRFVFFNKLIFTVDIYLECTNFGWMVASTLHQGILVSIK